MKGQVRWFDAIKGYGFIFSEEYGDIFVHVSEILPNPDNGKKILYQGDMVEFDTYHINGKGLKAKNVSVMKKEDIGNGSRKNQR